MKPGRLNPPKLERLILFFSFAHRRSGIFAAITWPMFACALLAGTACGEETERLIDRDPFDRIELDAANNHIVYEVLPLDFPNRQLPNPLPTTGTLEFRDVKAPTRALNVRWANIAEIKLYEQLLIEEASKLTMAGQLDDAYDSFSQLSRLGAPVPGLREAIDDFLYRNAFASFQEGRFEDALSIITALFERNPTRPGIDKAVNRIADELIRAQVKKNAFQSARQLLESFPKRYGALKLTCVPQWNRRLDELASKKLTEAASHLDAKRLDAARAAIRTAVAIRPESSVARQLAQKIHRARPRLVVAVDIPFDGTLTERLDDSASRRVRPLLQRHLTELSGYGNEGVVYTSPLGELMPDATGRHLTLLIDGKRPAASGLTAFGVSRLILAAAAETRADTRAESRPDRSYRELGNYLADVEVEDEKTLHIDWLRSHVRPEAMLGIDLDPLPDRLEEPASDAQKATRAGESSFRIASSTARETLFERRMEMDRVSEDAPIELIERSVDNEDAAIDMLRDGRIDMIARISPWNVQRLSRDENITVVEYALPTVHLLAMNPDRELLASNEMRRAIAYAIDGKAILDKIILAGRKVSGFATISGPFPVGRELDAPIAYGYNRSIHQHPYEPRLAAMLAAVAWQAHARKTGNLKEGEAPGDMPPLVLAHPRGALVRITCQIMARQWTAAGIPIEVKEVANEEWASGDVAWDLRYAELAVWEPIIDAPRLLGPHGELGIQSAYMALALRRLEEANNWKEVQDRLYAVHRVAHNELAVIPLWQTVNSLAYRKNIQGVSSAPVSLYDSISQWEKIISTN